MSSPIKMPFQEWLADLEKQAGGNFLGPNEERYWLAFWRQGYTPSEAIEDSTARNDAESNAG